MSEQRRSTSHAVNGLRLDVREAVALRVMPSANESAFYLSLFDDEIDARLESLTQSSGAARVGGPEPDANSTALRLEPTDALVVADRDGSVIVARGGACNFPLYWSADGERLVVSTALPVGAGGALSHAGLLDSVAVVTSAYKGEPNVMLRAPLAGWHRLRRGCVTRLVAQRPPSEKLIDHAGSVGAVDRASLVVAIRAALDEFGRRQRAARSKAVVELSGGVDSTLAAIAATAHGVALLGASVQFPYYEFRFEDDIQRATAEALAVHRTVVDGTSVLSYAPPAQWPRLDEPATRVIGLARDQAIATIASEAGIDRVYVGEGGDELFAEDMSQPTPATNASPLPRGLFSSRAWQAVEETRLGALWRPTLRRRSMLTSIHDARLDVTMKETYATVTRSPFTDLAMTHCGLQWAALTHALGERHSKRILTEAFEGEIPAAVLSRRDKVAWDGVFARAYAAHGDTIIGAFERNARVLGHLGIDVAWLVRRVGELSRWERTAFGPDDGAVFAVYALAAWLESWGIRLPNDHQWAP